MQELYQLTPTVAAFFIQVQSDNEATVLLLVKRKITWGEGAERQQKALEALNEKLRATPL
jgi:hypothetical protein